MTVRQSINNFDEIIQMSVSLNICVVFSENSKNYCSVCPHTMLISLALEAFWGNLIYEIM